MTDSFNIRLIDLNDAKATLEIYRPFVEKTVISFEYDVPDLQEWETRIKTNTAKYPWLVCEYNNEIIGYAYGSKHRYRTAYSWSAESTVYLSDKFHRMGIAKVLYETLVNLLKLQGYVNVYAGVTVPNEKSEAFHQALGFYEVGVFKKTGFKFGAWYDTRWFQLHLAEHSINPSKLKTLSEIQNTPAFEAILRSANAKLSSASRRIFPA
jgi:phosphinothricin acetyltransferase